MGFPRLRSWILVGALLAAGTALAKPDGTSTMPSKRPADFEVGKRLWQQSCWQCHGEKGAGDGPAAAAMPGGVPALSFSGEQIDAMVQVVQDGRGRMPAYSEDIDKHDSRRILQYIRDTMAGVRAPAEPKEDAADDEAGGQ
jgi:mono/diheme cytochrome c family protein